MKSKPRFNKLIIVLSIFSMGIISAAKQELPKEIDGMILKEDAKVDIAYVRPDVDWTKFKTIYIRELSVTDEAKDATPDRPPRGRGHIGDSWLIPEKDVQLMKTEFTRIMKEALENSGLKVISEIQADTLVLVPGIIDIYLKSPIEKSRQSNRTRGGVYSDGGGSMTLAATFADGENMQVIAQAVDNKYPSSMWKKNTHFQNISDMKRLFRSWGNNLSKALQNKQKKD